MKVLVVTAALITEGERFLITQRNENAHQSLKWEFPGGKLEPGETPEECLVREINEELGIIVEVDGIFQVVSHIYDSLQVVLLCYSCRYARGLIKAKECRDYRWVLLEECTSLEFSEADLPILAKLGAGFN